MDHPSPTDSLTTVQALLDARGRPAPWRLGRLRVSRAAGADAPGPTNEEAFRDACRLCDGGEFRSALPLAERLISAQPRDPRYAFLAATCLQRLGFAEPAARLYGAAGALGAGAAALYRFGECQSALGDMAGARRASDLAAEAAREGGQRDLHDLIQRFRTRLRSTP